MKVIGFMTGTSLDGVDVALIETDGKSELRHGPCLEVPMPAEVRALLKSTTEDALKWQRDTAEPASFATARAAIVRTHIEVLESFLSEAGLKLSEIDLIGIHGQTVLHERPRLGQNGRTVQLFDGQAMADATGTDIVCDFRQADVMAGGEGAPLAPIYHHALIKHSGLEPPVIWANLGGVANISLINGLDPVAFDTGPANGLMDQWMQRHGRGHFDEGGQLAAAGRIHEVRVAQYMEHVYFTAPPPKSLDRYDFTLAPVEGLSLEDGLATLSRFTRDSLIHGIRQCRVRPHSLILSGGGRHNHHLVRGLQEALPEVRIVRAEDMGWRGGAIEAEAFAYLAARSVQRLPISFPGTTGISHPMTGGVRFRPSVRT